MSTPAPSHLHVSDLILRGQKDIAIILFCGCWRINLAQGVAVLPCAEHQPAVLAAIGLKEEE